MTNKKSICITSGECLNEIMVKREPDKVFIPFNEAMITGTYATELFSEGFIEERSKTHNASVSEYKDKLHAFLELLENIDQYDSIYLYFGDEPFCQANRKTVIEALNHYGYQGEIISYIVNELTGDIISQI